MFAFPTANTKKNERSMRRSSDNRYVCASMHNNNPCCLCTKVYVHNVNPCTWYSSMCIHKRRCENARSFSSRTNLEYPFLASSCRVPHHTAVHKINTAAAEVEIKLGVSAVASQRRIPAVQKLLSLNPSLFRLLASSFLSSKTLPVHHTSTSNGVDTLDVDNRSTPSCMPPPCSLASSFPVRRDRKTD